MTINISLPEKFDFHNSRNFCLHLDALTPDMKYQFDYGKMKSVEPLGLLLIGSRLRRFINDKQYVSNILANNFTGNDYAAHMGFYKSIGLDHGKAPGEAKGSDTYIPITQIFVKDIRDEARSNNEHIVDNVENRARKIARVLSCGNDGVEKTLTYSIREIMRNVVEHSEADSVWFAGQYWPGKDRVEIAILDEGIGIYNSLRKNHKLKMNDTQDALYLSIEPGISGKDIRAEQLRDDVYGNSGYGLYMNSRICEEGGDFVIGSQDKILGIQQKGNRVFDNSLPGTFIRMRLRASKIQDLSKMLTQFLKEGELRSKQHSKSGILSASKSSRLLLNSD